MYPIVPLWNTTAPYTEQSPDQAQPSIKAFEAEGASVAVVVCPGGGYIGKADYEGDPIAEMFNSSGIAGYVLDYRVRPCHPMAPLTDAQRAIRLVRSMGYRWVGILGFSAGGHLACSAATHFDAGNSGEDDPVERFSCRPDFFIPCYPVVSFTQYPHYGSCLALLGNVDQHDLERFFSAELNVTPDTPPAFIWHTANDGAVPVENSLLLATALSKAKVPFELQIYPDGRHGLGLAEDKPIVCQWPGQCVQFIKNLAKEF